MLSEVEEELLSSEVEVLSLLEEELVELSELDEEEVPPCPEHALNVIAHIAAKIAAPILFLIFIEYLLSFGESDSRIFL